MNYKTLGLGLGLFSIALGAAELFGSRRIAKALDAEGHEGLVKGFGGRELLAGANLLAAPAHATNVWNRVAGDAMDLTALGLAAASRRRTVRCGARSRSWSAPPRSTCSRRSVSVARLARPSRSMLGSRRPPD